MDSDKKNPDGQPPASDNAQKASKPLPSPKEQAKEKKADKASELLARVAEYENDLKRLAAEFDNYKKRADREKADARAGGRAETMAHFVEMMETFDHALAQAEKKGESGSVREGLVLLHRKLNSIFASIGVREIECKGLPNHACHEVLLTVSGSPGGEIAQCLRKGYAMGDYVLRPAQVAVYAEEKTEKKKETRMEEKSGEKPSGPQ